MLRSVLRRFPLSLSGTTAIALSAIAFFHGARRQDLVLTLAGVWGLLVVGATGAAVMAYAWRTRRDLRLAVERAGDVPLDGVEERAFATGVTIPRRAWPLVTELDWIWSEPAAGVCVSVNGNRLAEQAVPRSRWFGARIVRSYVVQDLLGLWRIRGRLVRERPVLVLPDTGLLRAADVATCLSSGDLASHPFGDPRGDRVDFRTYTRSDPARLILWKVYARTRELMVRVPEPARTPETRPLVYLLAGEHDDAAAGLGRLLMESGVLGDGARFAADGSPDPVTERGDVHEALAASRAHRGRGGKDLAAALAHETVAPDDSVVLLCPGVAGRWLRSVMYQLARRTDRFLVIVAGDVAAEARAPAVWQKLVWRDGSGRQSSTHRGVDVAEMLRTARPLIGSGARVLMADRRTGRLTRLSGETAAAGAGA